MKTLKLTKDDFKRCGDYGYKYTGKEDLSNFEGNLEIDTELEDEFISGGFCVGIKEAVANLWLNLQESKET